MLVSSASSLRESTGRSTGALSSTTLPPPLRTRAIARGLFPKTFPSTRYPWFANVE
jgi:hypothetical protein